MMPKHTKPPVYLAVDLWMAMGMDSREFDAYYARNGWADTWSNLLGKVREQFRGETCGWQTEGGETCVLNIVGHVGPHMGASDVGVSERLPMPEPADPSSTCSKCGVTVTDQTPSAFYLYHDERCGGDLSEPADRGSDDG